MHETQSYQLYDIHKSAGVVLFAVVLARAAWRLRNGWPVPVGQYSTLEKVLAKASHWVLIVASILMPASGILSSGLGGHGVALFGLVLVPENPHPTVPYEAVAHNASIASFFESTHAVVAWVLVVVIGLHLAGALKHHLVDRDGTLRRMLGARID